MKYLRIHILLLPVLVIPVLAWSADCLPFWPPDPSRADEKGTVLVLTYVLLLLAYFSSFRVYLARWSTRRETSVRIPLALAIAGSVLYVLVAGQFTFSTEQLGRIPIGYEYEEYAGADGQAFTLEPDIKALGIERVLADAQGDAAAIWTRSSVAHVRIALLAFWFLALTCGAGWAGGLGAMRTITPLSDPARIELGVRSAEAEPPGEHVFISFANQDILSMLTVCSTLEEGGQKCWYAPRDIRSGRDYPTELETAIQGARAFVLVYTQACNRSRHVKAEVQRAFEKEKQILCIRYSHAEPAPGLAFMLGSVHWLDATGDKLDHALDQLRKDIATAVRDEPGTTD